MDGRTFRFYRPGYISRNEDITSLLKADPDSVVLIADIKNFYPTVDRNRAVRALNLKLHSIGDQVNSRGAVERGIDALLGGTSELSGLPIGSPLSHLLANLALADIDERMGRDYGDSYFRYVDDIVVVLPRQHAEVAKAKLRALLEEAGLQLHPDKTELIDASEWLAKGPQIPAVPDGFKFESFVDGLLVFLALHPELGDSLTSALASAEIGLPLGRFRQIASYGRFRQFLFSSRWRLSRALGRAHRFSGVNEVIAAALLLRESFLTTFDQFLGQSAPKSTNVRKWHFQRGRYLLNRLLYVEPRSSFKVLLSQIRNIPEFYDASAVLNALDSRDAGPILSLPGSPIRAYAELANHYGLRPQVTLQMETPSDAAIESLSVLGLYNLFAPSDPWLDRLPPRDSAYLRFCSKGGGASGPHDLSYLDEILTLKASSQTGSLHQLSTRFDDAEEVSLEALTLGGDYYL